MSLFLCVKTNLHYFVCVLTQTEESSESVSIRILYNPEVEWHETFVVALEDFQGASAGENNSAVINILDTDIAGGLVLPAVPIVSYLSYCVSALRYILKAQAV